MADKPKFTVFRAWVGRPPEKKTNGDRLRLPSQPDGRGQQTEVKVAQFFILVALLFVLADYLGRVQERTDANLGPDSTSLVHLILFLPEISRKYFRMHGAVPVEQRGKSFRLLADGHHDEYARWTTCYPCILDIGLGESVHRIETASPCRRGIYELESQVD